MNDRPDVYIWHHRHADYRIRMVHMRFAFQYWMTHNIPLALKD
jgi:hypothetical protein